MQSSASSSAAPAANPVGRPPRSQLEFWFVRGGMVLLLLLVGVQAHARFGYEMSLKKLQARLAEAETSHHDVELLLSDVPRCIVGWPSCSTRSEHHWRVMTYSWRGLTDTFQIHLPYDSTESQPAVMELVTADAPAPVVEDVSHVARLTAQAAHAMVAPEISGPGALGGSGGPLVRAGGQRPDIMASDADGDGKVSREEAPERMTQFFDRIDANADGFIDAEEAAAARRRRSRPPGAESEPSTPSTRPEAAPTEAPVDAVAPANASGEDVEENL